MAHAAHLQKDEKHCVMIGALRVLISHEEDNLWSAQGVEVDFAACGTSLEDVQRRFESGLRGTIRANLDRFGSIERLLKWAPEDEISNLKELSRGYDLTLITTHCINDISIPFSKIAYIQETLSS